MWINLLIVEFQHQQDECHQKKTSINDQFMDAQSLLCTLAGSVEKLHEEGDPCTDPNSLMFFESCHFWKHMNPCDSYLSMMHQARVHVISDSVFCLGPKAQNGASGKWKIKYQRHRSCAHKDISHKINGQYVEFVFHVFPGATSHIIMQEVQDQLYILGPQKATLAHLLILHTDSFMAVINEIE